MKRWLRASALSLLLASTAALADGARAKLDAFLANVSTLQAEFEQSLFDASKGQAVRLAGTFYLQRPGKFRWDYTEPKGQLVVADGSTVWLVEGDLEQVYQRSQSEALRGTPALLLAEKMSVDEQFEVVDVGAAQGLDWLELIPKDKESQFARVLLAFGGAELRRMELVDNFGQVSRFNFRDVRRNVPLKAELFEFKPPPSMQIFQH
ncbi:MAG: outer membrane lipoprotein chaperone LolA [Gammaproteobacteria bacterium]|nr:outer membrane lipoprotein chaperone LolA [Gammaproteobacteria bacterium]